MRSARGREKGRRVVRLSRLTDGSSRGQHVSGAALSWGSRSQRLRAAFRAGNTSLGDLTSIERMGFRPGYETGVRDTLALDKY